MTGFVKPQDLVAQTGIRNGQVLADLGCGGGFYSLPAAQIVGPSGTVYAVDIQESKLAFTQSISAQLGLRNIVTILGNLESPLEKIPAASCDVVICASILHEIGKRQPLLANAYRMLKTGGRLLTVEWHKGFTVFGPDQSRRMTEEDLTKEVTELGFHFVEKIPTDRSHFALLFKK